MDSSISPEENIIKENDLEYPNVTNATKDVVEKKIKIEEGEWELVTSEGNIHEWVNGKKKVIFHYGEKNISAFYTGDGHNERSWMFIYKHNKEFSFAGGEWVVLPYDNGPSIIKILPKTRIMTKTIPVEIPVSNAFGMKMVPGKLEKKQTHTVDISQKQVCIGKNCTIIADVSANHSVKLIYGRTQSGKTQETVEVIIKRMKVDNCTGIYFCRAYKQEQSEQVDNIKGRIQEYAGIDVSVVLVKIASDYKKITNSMKNGDSSTLYVVMANEASLSKIFNSMTDGDKVRFAVALDEADIYVKENSSSIISKKLKTIMNAAICKYFISATLLDVTSMIEESDIVEAIPSKFAFNDEVEGDDRYYHSVHNFIRYDIIISKEKTAETGLECAKKCVGQALKDNLHTEYNNRGLPYLICQFHTEKVKINEKIAKRMSSSKLEGLDIAAITFDAKGATVYENGKVINKFSRLNESIQYLKDKKTAVIHLMAGALCNRAFRVTSVDYEVYISLGIYGYNNEQEASTAVQKLGRMCGLTPKRLKCSQRVFCDQKVFKKVYDCTNITSSFIQTAVENPTEKFSDMKKMVKIPKRMSKKKLSVNEIESSFTVDKNIEPIHGNLREEEEENDLENDLSENIDKLKYMIRHNDNGTWRTHSVWYNLTGPCGYKDKSNHHKAMTQTLIIHGFVEKRKVNSLFEFRMKKN